MTRPDLFYDHNVGGTARLLDAMRACGVPRLVFSSSAAVYGAPGAGSVGSTLSEGASKDPASPYGDTKLACERMIAAYARAFGISAVALRYFNAAGADASAVIGEAHEPETHLIPLAIEAALGLGAPLTVFGTDFPTPGTSPTVCGGCGGAGRVRASQGFFSIERACPRCGGSGQELGGHGVGMMEVALGRVVDDVLQRDRTRRSINWPLDPKW